jgi:hypothetical protein
MNFIFYFLFLTTSDEIETKEVLHFSPIEQLRKTKGSANNYSKPEPPAPPPLRPRWGHRTQRRLSVERGTTLFLFCFSRGVKR